MKKYVVAGVLLAAVAVAAVLFLRKSFAPAERPSFPVQRIKGSPRAAVMIQEFSDFQCPACRLAQPALEELLNRHPDEVALVFRHFPLEGHSWSDEAHQAAECAAEQGNFWDYHDILFAGQDEWPKLESPLAAFLDFAGELGFNLDRFSTCLTDPRVREKVRGDQAEGMRLKITSTPTFFINEKRVVGSPQLGASGEEIVREILEKKS